MLADAQAAAHTILRMHCLRTAIAISTPAIEKDCYSIF
jgi:hypothetical protein